MNNYEKIKNMSIDEMVIFIRDLSDDCEDEVIITCKKCKNKMIVHSIVTEFRLWTNKYEEK